MIYFFSVSPVVNVYFAPYTILLYPSSSLLEIEHIIEFKLATGIFHLMVVLLKYFKRVFIREFNQFK